MIRYFLQFPSQTQVVDEILPAIEKLESTTDKSKDLIEIEAFEKHLIILLKTNQYASYDKETLIESFRMLDIEKNGYLDLHTFYSYIKSYGITFTKEQIEEMEKFLLENDNEVFESLGTKNDEPIKHKILDLIGDLYLTGVSPLNMRAQILVKEAGHAVHTKVAQILKTKLVKL